MYQKSKKVAILWLLIVIAVLSIGIALPPWIVARAVSDTPVERLTYGDSVTRTFTPNIATYLFSFYAQSGDVVTITMVAKADSVSNSVSNNATLPATSVMIDPALVLLSPTGQPIAQNDDSLDPLFGLTNARLVDFPIPAAGFYAIHATRVIQDTPVGTFVLTLKGQRSGKSRANINVGTPANGTITDATPTISYEFRAAAGDVLSAQLTSTQLGALTGTPGGSSPSVALLDATDATLQTMIGKKAGTALNRILITQDGVYTLLISRAGLAQAVTVGDFALTLNRDRHAAYLAYDDNAAGTITADAPETDYVFAGKAGDLITVTMRKQSSDTLAARLTLVTLDNRTLISAQNSSGTDLKRGDARIAKFRLPTSGAYLITAGRVGGAQGQSVGAYTLTLAKG